MARPTLAPDWHLANPHIARLRILKLGQRTILTKRKCSSFVSYLSLLPVPLTNSEVHPGRFTQCCHRTYSTSVMFVLYLEVCCRDVFTCSPSELLAALPLAAFAPPPALPSMGWNCQIEETCVFPFPFTYISCGFRRVGKASGDLLYNEKKLNWMSNEKTLKFPLLFPLGISRSTF